MTASEEIKSMIKAWEGLSLKAYKCPAGVQTIGYGHTGSDVSPNLTISQATADKLFEGDITRFERELVRWMRIDGVKELKQRQYDALVSFAFNLGFSRLRKSTLWRKVCANPDDATIAVEFKRWVHGGGKILPGLVKRREAEANVYAYGKYSKD